METLKWDGKSDSEAILEALLLLIDEEDKAKALTTSYGDFGKYLQKVYKGGAGINENFTVEGFKGSLRVTLEKKGVSYQLTWNKAAKLIHQHLHDRRKQGNV